MFRRDVVRDVEDSPDTCSGMIGSSQVMSALRTAIQRVAAVDATVLLQGESGTGKELAAEAVHALSRRAQGPLVKVNCAGFAEQLLDSELFGHVKGAFTGAIANRIGCFEIAQGGTLFLDEIGDIPYASQVRLLRVLEEKRFRRVGASMTCSADVRVIVATNRDLENRVQCGHFRADLFYRLSGMPVTLPPLRERREDIPELVGCFLRHLNRSAEWPNKAISRRAIDELTRRHWYGNVRELKNVVERAFVFCDGSLLDVDHLGPEVRAVEWPFCGERRRSDRTSSSPPSDSFSLRGRIRPGRSSAAGVDGEAVRRALERHRWHIGRTANALNIHRTTLWRYMQRLGLNKCG